MNFFEDVRREEFSPSYADSSKRIDFILPAGDKSGLQEIRELFAFSFGKSAQMNVRYWAVTHAALSIHNARCHVRSEVLHPSE